uniref:hypothetical protein n=1 Tax=uncultured Sphingomonas sp. TaxID=158754 RepID=UPI0035C9869A
MFRKLILPASLGLSALAALVPGVATAQSYGDWNAHYNYSGGYGDSRYDDRRGYDDRGSYRDRQRWIAHRRWEHEKRRREWAREHRRGEYYGRDGYDRGRYDREGY